MGARQLPLKVGVKREQFRQETRPDLDEVGGLHAPPSCVASSSAYLVRNRAADSGKGGKPFHSFQIPPTVHTLQRLGKSSQVSLLHEGQLSFLWNVLPGLDEPIHRSQPGDTASESHTCALGSDLPRKSLSSPVLAGERSRKTLLARERGAPRHRSNQGICSFLLTPGSLNSKGFVYKVT